MATIKLKTLDSVSDLKRAIKKSADADQKNRIKAIINIKEGATKTATAKKVCCIPHFGHIMGCGI